MRDLWSRERRGAATARAPRAECPARRSGAASRCFVVATAQQRHCLPAARLCSGGDRAREVDGWCGRVRRCAGQRSDRIHPGASRGQGDGSALPHGAAGCACRTRRPNAIDPVHATGAGRRGVPGVGRHGPRRSTSPQLALPADRGSRTYRRVGALSKRRGPRRGGRSHRRPPLHGLRRHPRDVRYEPRPRGGDRRGDRARAHLSPAARGHRGADATDTCADLDRKMAHARRTRGLVRSTGGLPVARISVRRCRARGDHACRRYDSRGPPRDHHRRSGDRRPAHGGAQRDHPQARLRGDPGQHDRHLLRQDGDPDAKRDDRADPLHARGHLHAFRGWVLADRKAGDHRRRACRCAR